MKAICKSFSLFLLYLPCVSGVLLAQDQNEKNLKTDSVVIVKEYNATISDAFRIPDKPNLFDIDVTFPEVDFELINKQIPLVKLYKSYAKLGFGSNLTTLFNYHINNTRSREHSIGLSLQHFGTQGKIAHVGNTGFSQNNVELYGKKFLPKHLLSGAVNYSYNTNHFYGYNPTVFLSLTEKNTQQYFSKISSNVGLVSFIKDSTQFNYDINASYYYLSDRYNAFENNVVLQSSLKQYYGKELLKMEVVYDFNNFRRIVSANSSIIKLHPQIISKGEKYQVNAGLGIFVDAEKKAKFYFKPIAEASYNLVDEILIPYIGVTGEIKRNNYNSFTTENPFLVSNPMLKNTNKKPTLFVGIKGALSSKMSFNTSVSFGTSENQPLYVTDRIPTYQNRFSVIYDTIQTTHVNGEISYQESEKIRLILRGDYFMYQTNFSSEAWNLPQYKLTLSSEYNLKDKLIGKVDIYALPKRQALTYLVPQSDKSLNSNGGYTVELNGIIDINLGLEYRYTSRLSAFVNFNNIAATRYSRWYNYPSQRFNLLGGLTCSF